jgi:hypothetical protein
MREKKIYDTVLFIKGDFTTISHEQRHYEKIYLRGKRLHV